ncbi:MAG: hypothetical protein NUV51_03570 [Sulfuricaulis sp.]|nr:hypothetical protein [Sulfuricaulis sp.]
MSTPSGGPVFPVQDVSKWQCCGISVRDWFASAALQGLIASEDNSPVTDDLWLEIGLTPPDVIAPGDTWTHTHYAKLCAVRAYRHADAMLAERDKP